MISFLYIVGVTVAVLVLWSKLREKNGQLRAVIAQRDYYAVAAQAGPPALAGRPDDGPGREVPSWRDRLRQG
jgi:hypothetical protein